jgi:hypothetical protein
MIGIHRNHSYFTDFLHRHNIYAVRRTAPPAALIFFSAFKSKEESVDDMSKISGRLQVAQDCCSRDEPLY